MLKNVLARVKLAKVANAKIVVVRVVPVPDVIVKEDLGLYFIY